MSDDFVTFAAELEAHPAKVGRQLRGAMARRLDTAAADAQQKALATWTTHGRGMAGSAGTIRARMSRSVGARGGSRQLGYLLADGEGAFFQEHGTGHHPPQPVLGDAAERAMESTIDELGRIAGEW